MKTGTGGRLVWLPVLFLCGVACSSFGTTGDDPSPAETDGGSTSSSGTSGTTGRVDAASDAPVSSGCTKVAPFEQPFAGGDFTGWQNTPGTDPTISTAFSSDQTGGKAKDGALLFSYDEDDQNPRRNVVERPLADGRCFSLAVSFAFSHVEIRQLIFSEIKFENKRLLAMAIDPDLHVIIAQQDGEAFQQLGRSSNAINPGFDMWHEASLELTLDGAAFTAQSTIDGSPIILNPALFEFDQAASIEVGVSYVQPAGRGDIEIDRVAFH